MAALVGQHDEIFRAIEAAFPGTSIVVRGNEVIIDGTEAISVERLFNELVLLLESGTPLDTANVVRTIDMIRMDEVPSEILTAEVLKSARGRSVRPKTAGQKRYTDAILYNTITFGIGPAGTGQEGYTTPSRLAVQALQAKTVERIILRPVPRSKPVSASASSPATCCARSTRTCARSTTRSTTCSRPRARSAARAQHHRSRTAGLMRGRTLNGSFIILDEAQNTTPEQMKMFLAAYRVRLQGGSDG